MWVKVDGTTRAMRTVIAAQDKEVAIAQKQALANEVTAQEARNAEHTRSIQFSAAILTLQTIQKDVENTLAKAQEINTLILQAIQESKAASLQAESAASSAASNAQNAASAAGGAAGAAQRAAASASHTGAVVATKVVTTNAREELNAERAALARKKAQLSRTIKQVKKNGPTILQQIFH